ncbi:MAG TPA: VOC family protein [Thermoleophilaceae bacterium]|nr:VOC family protein [Thermoleophilaceae bacterium]
MSERDDYPAGVPCWVEGLHRDPDAAREFYGALMGWEFEGSGGEPEYFVARLRGREVAGLAPMPEAVQHADGVWMTHVAVDDAAATAEAATAAGGHVLAGPLDVSPAGTLVVITDPGGAGFCAWEPEGRAGAELINEPGAWSMSVLRTGDADVADAFYGTLFGWQAEPFGPPEGGAALYRLPGYVGGTPTQPVPRDVVAVRMSAEDGEAPGWALDFWIDDAEEAVARAAELGGTVVAGPYDAPPAFRQAVLSDPQGGAFSVSQLVPDRL